MYRLVVVTALVSGITALYGCGITGNFRLDPGYARFGSLGLRDTDREFALSLGPLPIAIARKFMQDEPEIRKLLKGLKAVRVYVYAVDGDARSVRRRFDGAWARLEADGWDTAVAVREDGESVRALVRSNGQAEIRGLVVMVQDAEEVVLVNVIGDIDPQAFGAVMVELGFESPLTDVRIL
jgi:hypothetical protein